MVGCPFCVVACQPAWTGQRERNDAQKALSGVQETRVDSEFPPGGPDHFGAVLVFAPQKAALGDGPAGGKP